MTKNDLMSLLEFNSPVDYLILTPLVSFISLCASFEVGLIHLLGTLTLTDIDHVSIMKSSVMKPHTEIPILLVYMGIEPHLNPYIGSIDSKNYRYKETHTRHSRQSHLMRFT